MPTTPGLYRQPVTPVRAAGRLSRGDVPAFLGYARRGPVGLPVRIESMTAFEELFGERPETGHLSQAMTGFFETGGRTAYVLRVAQDDARAASVELPGGVWRAQASFPWVLVDPREQRRQVRPEEACWVQLIEDVFRTSGPRSPAPGAWGNRYAVRVSSAERVRTETVPGGSDDPRALVLHSLAGLEAASVLTLAQTRTIRRADGTPVPASVVATLVPAAVDPVRQRVVLSTPDATLLDQFDLTASIQVVSVEFDVEIHVDGKLEQAFRALSPNPDHSASITRVVDGASRSLSFSTRAQPQGHGWADPASWPAEGTYRLTGGTDGLESIGRADYLAALAQVARLDEVSLVAAPDLVLQNQNPQPAQDEPAEAVDCTDLSPPEPGRLQARVVEVDLLGHEQPLPGVAVDVTGPGGRATTGADGTFSLTGLALGLVTVRLAKPGFESLETLAQSTTFFPPGVVTLTMTRLRLPRALADDEILEVGQAMADPGLVGPYKVAILDPPRPDATLDDLRTWRARLGESDRIGLFAPWLLLPAGPGDPGTATCPPSGHVCGAFAAGELALGVHRTGANLPLRHVQGVTLEIGDPEQGVLNPIGVNAIRSFPGRGVRIFGTRTLSADPEWTYLTSRRIVDAIERTLTRALHWMVLEPNNLMTRHAVARTAESLLNRLWRNGIISGESPGQAYAVKCDLENNPRESREAGRLVADIGVAPTTPYEFVLFRIGSAYEALTVTEVAR